MNNEDTSLLRLGYAFAVLMTMLPILICGIAWWQNQNLPHDRLLKILIVLILLFCIEKFICINRWIFSGGKL